LRSCSDTDPWLLFENALNLGVIAAFMFDAGKADIFLGLLTPHGCSN